MSGWITDGRGSASEAVSFGGRSERVALARVESPAAIAISPALVQWTNRRWFNEPGEIGRKQTGGG